MPPRDNIVLIKRKNPKRVQLPNGRVFYAKYQRVSRDALPGNVRIRRKYKKERYNVVVVLNQCLKKQLNSVKKR